MPYINYERKEISFKIVYYGPGMSGKTTNLVQIHKAIAGDRRGELITLDTEEERTLFFDFFPLELGEIGGYKVHFNMYTIPGQIYYESSRRLILDGADGVAFVADSQSGRFEDNLVSYEMMIENIRSYDLDPEQFPIVLQYNKRDADNPIAVGSIESKLGLADTIPVFEAIATKSKGVLETVREISKQVINKFQL